MTMQKTKEKLGVQIPAFHKLRGISRMGPSLQNSIASETNPIHKASPD